MRFGVMLNTQHALDEPTSLRFRESLEHVRLLRELGYDSVWVGQHYLSTPYQTDEVRIMRRNGSSLLPPRDLGKVHRHGRQILPNADDILLSGHQPRVHV